MDIVSFETAIALKNAGFIGHSISPGHFWYDISGKLFVITQNTGVGSDLTFKGSYIGGGLISGPIRDYCHFYAASSTEIMRELKDKTIGWDGEQWVIDWLDPHGVSYYLIDETPKHPSNPAEAAAKDYLRMKTGLKF